MNINKALERIRAVNHARIEYYHTTPDNCDCVDFKRGGSMSSPDHRDCKHTIKLTVETNHFNTRKIGAYWVCACAEWDNSNGEGLEGSCLHTQALQGWKQGALANV